MELWTPAAGASRLCGNYKGGLSTIEKLPDRPPFLSERSGDLPSLEHHS